MAAIVHTLKADKACDHCGYIHKKGAEVLYYPTSKKVYCNGDHLNQPDPGTELYFLERIDRKLGVILNKMKSGASAPTPGVADDDIPF